MAFDIRKYLNAPTQTDGNNTFVLNSDTGRWEIAFGGAYTASQDENGETTIQNLMLPASIASQLRANPNAIPGVFVEGDPATSLTPIQQQRSNGGIGEFLRSGDFLPGLGASLVLGPAAGELAGFAGFGGNAGVTGAIKGGLTSALTGGNPVKGAVQGGVSSFLPNPFDFLSAPTGGNSLLPGGTPEFDVNSFPDVDVGPSAVNGLDLTASGPLFTGTFDPSRNLNPLADPSIMRGIAAQNPFFDLSGLGGDPSFTGTFDPGAPGNIMPPASPNGDLGPLTPILDAGAGAGGAGISTGALLAGGAAAAGLAGALAGGKKASQTTTTAAGAISEEERALLDIQRKIAERQLAAIDQLTPYQQELLQTSLEDIRATTASNRAVEGAVNPAERAALARSDFERAQRFGPIQDELMQIQIEQARLKGAASPEQRALIQTVADRAIESGSADIDLATERGIGLIADELANSRGLRLTDTPIAREATLLSRSGADQKANLIRNLRAGQATAELNYPLAVQQVQSASNLGTQSVADAAARFQEDLRQRAYQNRLALTGQVSGTGIGLASIGSPSAALSALAANKGRTSTVNTTSGIGLSDIGQAAGGIGGAILGLNTVYPGLFGR